MKTLRNLLDDDALDINSTYPGIIVRKGMGLLSGIVVLFLCLISFIPYPDKIHFQSTIDPVSKRFVFNTDTSNFKLQTLFKSKGQHVTQHEKIALLVNYSTNQEKELYAPFSGIFLVSGNSNDKIILYVLCRDTLVNTILSELTTAECRGIKPMQKVKIEYTENEPPLNGLVKSITPIPLENKSSVLVLIAQSDQVRLQTKLKVVNLQPLSVIIDIYINKLTVLNKAFGVLTEKFHPDK